MLVNMEDINLHIRLTVYNTCTCMSFFPSIKRIELGMIILCVHVCVCPNFVAVWLDKHHTSTGNT